MKQVSFVSRLVVRKRLLYAFSDSARKQVSDRDVTGAMLSISRSQPGSVGEVGIPDKDLPPACMKDRSSGLSQRELGGTSVVPLLSYDLVYTERARRYG
jgi:hypothetical protein